MSLISKDEYAETDSGIIALNKRRGGNKVLHNQGGTNTRTDWLIRSDWCRRLGKFRMERTDNPRYGTSCFYESSEAF